MKHLYLAAYHCEECNMSHMEDAFIDRAETALVVSDLQKGVVGRQTAPVQQMMS